MLNSIVSSVLEEICKNTYYRENRALIINYTTGHFDDYWFNTRVEFNEGVRSDFISNIVNTRITFITTTSERTKSSFFFFTLLKTYIFFSCVRQLGEAITAKQNVIPPLKLSFLLGDYCARKVAFTIQNGTTR